MGLEMIQSYMYPAESHKPVSYLFLNIVFVICVECRSGLTMLMLILYKLFKPLIPRQLIVSLYYCRAIKAAIVPKFLLNFYKDCSANCQFATTSLCQICPGEILQFADMESTVNTL